MSLPTNTWTSYSVTGNREDLEDIIFDISPTDTPFVSNIARVKANAHKHEWQTDSLAAPGANAQLEGDDATNDTATPTSRFGNYTQILRKVVGVSGSQRAHNPAGRKDEFSYQVAKRSREIKLDLEYAACRNQPGTAGGVGTAPMMAGLETWLWDNKTELGSGEGSTVAVSSGVPGTAPTDASSRVTVTEDVFKSLISQIYSVGGNPGTILVGVQTKKKMSGTFNGIATRYREVPGMQQAAIVAGADLYISDYGEHRLVPSRVVRDRNIFCLDMEYWAMAAMRPFSNETLAKTGDSDRTMIIGEYTLVARNPKASGKVTGFDPAK